MSSGKPKKLLKVNILDILRRYTDQELVARIKIGILCGFEGRTGC